jgi:hypothetical protein
MKPFVATSLAKDQSLSMTAFDMTTISWFTITLSAIFNNLALDGIPAITQGGRPWHSTERVSRHREGL